MTSPNEQQFQEAKTKLLALSDDELSKVVFALPWQYGGDSSTTVDEDGVPLIDLEKDEDKYTRERLQTECWNKFHKNPQINTAIRGRVGRLTGLGYEISSDIQEIQDVIDEISDDHRNSLWKMMIKYVGRFEVEGELFLCLTCHSDGFIEIDFIDPSTVKGFSDNSGIISHPTKPCFPLFYQIEIKNSLTGLLTQNQIPSINIARYPTLINVAKQENEFNAALQESSRSKKRIFSKFGGYYRFIIAWDKGFLTKRCISYLRTIIKWINYYENLKQYEIDHKKSAGAYLWTVTMTDPKAFKIWLSLSDDERKKTGIGAKKTPGSTLVLPPGMELKCVSPQLPNIKDSDTDIMEMVSSGLNEPEDVTSGISKGTFASVKASRGPMSDRISDDIAYFDRWQRYDFWGNIFFLKSKITDFPEVFEVQEAVDFDKQQNPIMKSVKRRAEKLIDISYPTSEMLDFEARAKGLLGVKHGPLADNLGISYKTIASKLGVNNYGKERLRYAAEQKKYPKLQYMVDQEAMQENALNKGEEKPIKGKTTPVNKPKNKETK